MSTDPTNDHTGSPLGTFLRGVRVLDLSHYLPGPMATLFLSDMGAEVIKIEPPRGDEMRTLGPRDPEGRPLFYETVNAGKTVRLLDLKCNTDRATFLDLVRGADVVVEGFRPGVMRRLGIDYPVLREINPGIVLCSISGYGIGTTAEARAGHDVNYLALGGVLDRNGTDAPHFFDPPVADAAGSFFAAMLGALHGRGRTGQGCFIDLALADTVMPLQMMQLADHAAQGTVPRRGEAYLNGGAAYYQVYATQGGRHVALGAIEPKFWAAFCRAARRADWVARQADPLPQRDLRAEVAALFAALTCADIVSMFGDADCCLSLVNDLGQALAEPQVGERKLVRRSERGELQALYPAWIDGSPPATRTPIRYWTDGRDDDAVPPPTAPD